jgi:dipeptidyl aminopeptidase/acylaminoacyl peptidase
MMNEIPLIERKRFFSNPDKTSINISPDGELLSWLAPVDGVLNVWIASRDNLSNAHPVTKDMGRGIHYYLWAKTSRHILYLQDKNGDENFRLYVVDLSNDNAMDLTPFENVVTGAFFDSIKYPNEIVIALNNRDPQWYDAYRINILTAERTLLLQNDRFASIVVDDDYRIRAAMQINSDGGSEYYVPNENDWSLWTSIPPEDSMTTRIIDFDKTNEHFYMIDSRGRNTSALVEVDIETKDVRVLASDPKADVSDIIRRPTEKHIEAVSFTYDRERWQILDPTIAPDLDYLKTIANGEIHITSRSLDDRYWTVEYAVDNGPRRFYLYDRSRRTAEFLFTNRKELENLPLAKMHSIVIKSRDGLDLVGYYTLPEGSDSDSDGIPDTPLPMVFTPHGGPWSRDFWGFSAWDQWLSNRGYAVLCINFRSSTGFGKAFTNAGDLEWGGKIIDDQTDAVKWSISAGIADPKRIAVMGGSFGGYSTLAGLAFHPELYVCGVDLVGVANLMTFLESVPPYWKPELNMMYKRVGDIRTEEGRELLKKHSPLASVDQICKPLLIAQGANDPRVKKAESDQIASAMQAKGLSVAYLLYPDEGHGFVKPENNMSFYAIAESFLAKHLGGRCEPIGEDFEGSSLQVLMGAEEIPGLKESL